MKLSTQYLNAICLAISAVASLGSCSFLGKQMIEKPKVELANVGVKDPNAKGATVVFSVKVDNPNSFPLKIDMVRYKVEISGKAFTSGQLEKAADVAANASSVVNIPVQVAYQDVYSSVLDFLGKGSSRYRIHGDASFGWLTIPFDESGDFKLKP